MKIEILPSEKILVVSYKGESLNFSYGVWGKLNKEPTDKIFGFTNEYLERMSEEALDRIWVNYKSAWECLHSIGQIQNMADDLIGPINAIADEFDFEDLLEWATSTNKIQPQLSIPVVNNTRNNDRMTLLRHEGVEVSAFCILVKILAPIFGAYVAMLKPVVGNKHKELIAGKIFMQCSFTKMRPFLRIEEYLEEFARARSKNINTALSHNMSGADLDKFLLGMTLIRRFCIIPLGYMKEVTIIQYVFKFLDDQIKDLSSSIYTDKFKGDSGGSQEADAYSDQWRVSQSVPDNVPEEDKFYLEIPERICEHIGFDAELTGNTITLFNGLMENKHFVISDFHLPLSALLVRHKIDPPSVPFLERRERLLLIAIAAAKAHRMGLTDLYSILIAVKKPADVHNMYMQSQNGQKFQKISQELDAQLDACYPHKQPHHISNGTNQGKEMIDAMVKEISGSDWLELESLTDIRNSIAKFFIHR